jgi:TRAP-type mannitol/chloroaromatic compound transport system permease small subunit
MAEHFEPMDEMIAGRRAGDPDRLPDDMPVWMRHAIARIDHFSILAGKVICWLSIPLMAAMVYEIAARYLFTAPTAWAYDISRMLYGAMFVLGAGYALQKGVHIRSDFLYRDWPVRTQGRVDLAMYVVLYFPTMLVLLWFSGEWAWTSVVRTERGMDTTWMPYLGPIKMCLPIGVLGLILQGFSESLKAVYASKHGRWPGNGN